ncbi:hypothetical protein SAMN05216571_101259 [Onishia taeanensis]|uniref:Uncharacterized protein n=1 Tax=Onishia taeanensis TaxID=284577 RepID=A0A1G7N6Z4_9GAMM|nr:hypothetical protein [Halomonas taeanensis]SDF69712.1 hypothetical protein SAMN05216571_101259 [Halomonas taeanensis]
MAQATVLAAGTAAATSSDIVVAAGESVTVAIFAASGRLPTSVAFAVKQDTPGGDNVVARLTNVDRATVLAGPGTYRVQRPAYAGTAFGVFTET